MADLVLNSIQYHSLQFQHPNEGLFIFMGFNVAGLTETEELDCVSPALLTSRAFSTLNGSSAASRHIPLYLQF
jgi:hypothetical protein